MLYCIVMIDKRTDSSYNHSHKKSAKSFAKAPCKVLDIKRRIGQNSQLRSFAAKEYLCPNKTITHNQIFSHHTHKTEFSSLCVFYSTTDWDNPKHKIP